MPQADPVNGYLPAGDPPAPPARSGPRWLSEWLPAGLGLRPWAALLVVSLAVIGLGGAMLVTNLYRMFIIWQTGTPFLYWATLQFIPHPGREIGVAALGLAGTLIGYRSLVRAVRAAALRGDPRGAGRPDHTVYCARSRRRSGDPCGTNFASPGEQWESVCERRIGRVPTRCG